MGRKKTDRSFLRRVRPRHFKAPRTRRQLEQLVSKILIRQDLIALRKSRGLTQKQLAERMGVSQPVVAELESAAPRDIKLSTLARAAAALGGSLKVTIEEAAPRRKASG